MHNHLQSTETMGRVFSALSGRIERWTTVFRLQITYPVENTSGEEDDDSGKDDYTGDIQIQDCPDGSDLHLNENRQEDFVLRGDSKPTSAMKCTYNVQVYNGNNVATGDNNTIIVRQSERVVKELRIAKSVDIVVPGDVSEEAQISSSPTVVENSIVHDPFIMAIGDGNVIYVLPECNFCLGEVANLKDSVRRRLFPLPMLPSVGIDPGLKKVFHKMCGIVDQLYPLRDSGKMQEFEEAFNQLQSRYNIHSAIKSFLLLEESTSLTYQKSFKIAKRKARQSANSAASEISGALQDVLRVLANVALASIYRRLPTKKLGRAFDCLKDARESRERLRSINLPMATFALARFDYEQARCYMEFAKGKRDSKSSNKEAEKLLGRCIDRCQALSNENQLYTAKQAFALVCLAHLSLPVTTGFFEPSLCKKMTKQSAKKAEKHLDEYKRSHLGDSLAAAKVKYFMTRSELCFLKRKYTSAEDFGCKALAIAEKYGLVLEIVPVRNHVDRISRYCSTTMRQEKPLPIITNRSSWYSSSTSTNSDQKYNLTCSQRAT